MIRLYYIDANCLVKLVADEPLSEVLREHVGSRGKIFATTEFCLYEALGVLKAKWIKQSRPDAISEDKYISACKELFCLVEEETIEIENIQLFEREVFQESQLLISDHTIDLSDAFQLISLKKGMLSRLGIGTAALVSEDNDLRTAGTSLGFRVTDINGIQQF